MKREYITILAIFLALTAIIAVSILGGRFLAKTSTPQTPIIEQPTEPITGPLQFETDLFEFEDRFSLELIDGWKLISENPDQRVDRYRFERANGTTAGVMTLSFYDAGDITTFKELIERRYGGAILDQEEDFEIDGKPAKRIVASFLGNGTGVRQGADVLIEIEEGYFISINGLHYKEGEDAALMLSQIDYMQTSFVEQK